MFSWDVMGLAALETAKISVPTIVDALLSRTSYARCDARLDSWSRRLLEQTKTVLDVRGKAFVEAGQSYVVMSNHQSHYDIPVAFQALRIPLRMVAKTELFRIPVMGRAMLDSGFVELDRSNRKRSIESLKLARKRIVDDRLSIWIAPEGTRSKDGSLGRFKTGGFYLALEAGVPILPLAIDGSIRVHRAGEWAVHKRQTVRVNVGAPIDPREYTRATMNALIERVNVAIRSGLEQTADVP
jgi:1-acyl-sn-glycerol-3-phosphate acyltransferase